MRHKVAIPQGPDVLKINGELVWGEVPVNQFTDEMLNHEYAGNGLEITWHYIGIYTHKWLPADERNPNRIRCVWGTIKQLSVSGDGDIGIEVTPDPGQSVSGGQATMECELPWGRRKQHQPQLVKLRPNMHVKICGFWVRDFGHGGSLELHPITSILIQ